MIYGDSYYGLFRYGGGLSSASGCLINYCNAYINDNELPLSNSDLLSNSLNIHNLIIYFSSYDLDQLNGLFGYKFKVYLSTSPDFSSLDTKIIILDKNVEPDRFIDGLIYKGLVVTLDADLYSILENGNKIFYKIEVFDNDAIVTVSYTYYYLMPSFRYKYFIDLIFSKISSLITRSQNSNIYKIYNVLSRVIGRIVFYFELKFLDVYIARASDESIKKYALILGIDKKKYVNINSLDFREIIINYFYVARYTPTFFSIKKFVKNFCRSNLYVSKFETSEGINIYDKDLVLTQDRKYLYNNGALEDNIFIYNKDSVYNYIKMLFNLKYNNSDMVAILRELFSKMISVNSTVEIFYNNGINEIKILPGD